MKKKNTGSFVIYSRKSKFTGKGESVENQIELCRQYIAATFSVEAAQAALVYEDEGFSGRNLERPQFKQMIKDSHKRPFAAIVVYRLDRISRNIGDFAKLIDDLGNRDIDFISIKEQFDTSSPMGRAMMYIASVFSQLERETIAERIRDNMHELAKTGRWLGGTTPTGYTSESISHLSADGKVRKACKLKIVPEEITLIKKIFDLFLETGSLTGVDQYLLEHQFKTKRGKDFTRFAIRGILTNPVYMIADADAYDYMAKNEADLFSAPADFDGTHGIMAYNRTLQRSGKTSQINPMREWIVSVGQHPGIIPGAVWIAVQEKLEFNRSKGYRSPRGSSALLSGLLICGSCGGHMRSKMTGRTTTGGEPVYTYMCTMKERSRSKICSAKNISGNCLDIKVSEAIKDLWQDSHEAVKQILQTKQLLHSNPGNHHAEAEKIKAQIDMLDSQTKALLDTLSRATGTAAESYILERIDELSKSGEGCRRRLKELETIAAQCELNPSEFDGIHLKLSRFQESFDTYSAGQKQIAIRALVKRAVWDGENVHLYVFGKDGDLDFPSIPVENAQSESFIESEVPSGEDSK